MKLLKIILSLLYIFKSFAYIANKYSNIVLNSRLYSTQANNIKEYYMLVPLDAPKCRLDVFISDQFTNHTRSYIAGLCDDGLVNVNNKPQSKSYKVKHGDDIKFTIEDKQITNVTPENIHLDILYEDDNILAVNKPAGMVVHPAVGSPNGTFVNALLYHLGPNAKNLLAVDAIKNSYNSNKEMNIDNVPDDDDNIDEDSEIDLDLPETPEAANASPVFLRPGIVHRLDKGTSGVLLAGKTPEAVASLSKLFALRNIRKIYLAICVGHPGETTIINPIGRSQKNRQLMCTYEGLPGKAAVSHVRTLCFDGKLSVCLVRIETGRTHQIRVHLKERRTPILGDSAYGASDWNKKLTKSDQINRPLLHAYETIFINPFTNKEVIVRAPIPNDMAKLINKMTSQSSAIIHTDSNIDMLSMSSIQQEYNNIIDPITNLLTVSTEVKGRELFKDLINYGSGSNSNNNKLQIDISRSSSTSSVSSIIPVMKGFVPFDRVLLDDDQNDWLNEILPETNET